MKIEKKHIIQILFCIIIIGFSLSFERVQAAVTSVPPDSFKDRNELIFKNNVSFSKATSNNAGVRSGRVQTGQFKGQAFVNWDDSKLSSTDYIDLEYKNTGTYMGKEVSVTVRLSDFVTGRNRYDSEKNTTDGYKNYIIFTSNLIHGFTFSGIGSMSATFKAYYNDDNTPVNFEDNSYITFNSLNGSKMVDYQANNFDAVEFAGYEKMSTLSYYVTATTGVKEYINPITKTGSVVGGVVVPSTDDKFTDTVGASDFTNGSVTFAISGQNPKFTIGSTSYMMWVAFNSSAVFNMKPEIPQKIVNINKQEVVSGQEIQYGISQKVNILNIDILTRYSSFEIIDILPDKVSYLSSKLVDKDNREVDVKGSYFYNKESHNLTYTSSSDFLKTMKMNGETYTLLINVKVNDDIRASDTIKNTGKVIINNLEQSTNEVENKGSDPVGAFKIYKVTDQITRFDPNLQLPIYEEKPQSGVFYKILANAEIKLTDGTIAHAADENLGEISTNEKGIAEKTNIYAGQYKAIEFAAPIGIQVDPTPIIIDVMAEKDIVLGEGAQKDPLQEVKLVVNKIFEQENGNFTEDGIASFGLYYASDYVVDEEISIMKDTLVSNLEVENGKAVYQGILIPDQEYYVKEIKTASGYQLNESKFYFTYKPVSNEAVHEIQLFENGLIDGELKTTYKDGEKDTTELNEEVLPIKNMMIRKNDIQKSILKKDGTRIDHYDLLNDGESVNFEGMVYIGDNDSIESLKLLDNMPDGFTLESMKIYDDNGNEVTKKTTYEVNEQSVALILNKEYAESLKRTSLRWVLETTYHYKNEHDGKKLENQMILSVNNQDALSNVVTLTPPAVELKEEKAGVLPDTGEQVQRYVTLIGAIIFLGVISFWYTRKVQQTEEIEKNEDE